MAALLRAAAVGGAPAKGRALPALWLLAALAFGQYDVLTLEAQPPTEITVKAGTGVRLPCAFISTEEITAATSVTWSFQREGSTSRPITFFYYSAGKEYIGRNTQFSGRSRWDGNFTMSDASIRLEHMEPADNGTYFCDVKNPPDIVIEPVQVIVNVLEPETPAGHGRTASTTMESATAIATDTTRSRTRTTTSGSISLNRASFWPLPFSCILASFPTYLF